MKKVIIYALLVFLLASPFAVVGATSSNVTAASNFSEVSEIQDPHRFRIGNKYVKKAFVGFATGFSAALVALNLCYNTPGGGFSEGVVIPESALD